MEKSVLLHYLLCTLWLTIGNQLRVGLLRKKQLGPKFMCLESKWCPKREIHQKKVQRIGLVRRLIYFTLKSNALSKERFFGLWTPEWWQSGSGIKRGRKETICLFHTIIFQHHSIACYLMHKKPKYISSHPCFILLSPLSVLGELIELMAKKHSTVSWGQKGMGEEEAGRACLKWKKNLQTIKK